MQHAEAVMSSLGSEVVSYIQSRCSCRYPKENLQEETLVPTCIGSRDEPFIQATYRARLLSTAEHNVEEIIGYIEARRLSNEAVPLQIGHTLSSLVLSSADSCPTRIQFRAASLCKLDVHVPAEESPSSTEEITSSAEGGVSTTTLTTALLAEFISLMTLFLLVAVASVCFTKARRKW